MSQHLNTIEQVFRPVITAAFKSLENKTYDTNREDYMDVLLEDLFTILFPKTSTTVTAPPSPPKEKKKPGPKPKESPPKAKPGPKPKASKTEGEGQTSPPKEKKKPGPKPKESPPKAQSSPATSEKKKPGPKPKLDENGNPVNKPRNRSPKPEEEKKKPGPKPKLNEEGKPVNKPRNRSPKSEPLPPSPINVAKVDPTIRKKLKEAAKELKVTYEKEQDSAFLEWVNSLSPEEFAEMGDEYPKRYFQKDTATTPAPSPENPPQPPNPSKKEEEVESELVEVFGEKGENLWLDKQTGRIYEGEGDFDPEVGFASYKALGYAGEGAFKNIKV